MLLARVLLGSLLLASACTTYRDQLARSERAFDAKDPDRTLALLRDLEPDLHRLSPAEQAEYAYLRGMTDYNVGYKPDARHWLSVARSAEANSPGVLSADRKARTTEVLTELNNVVYTEGTTALTTTRQDPTAPAPKPDLKPAP